MTNPTEREQALERVLKRHMEWHNTIGVVQIDDGNGNWTELDLSMEYSDSGLCEDALKALAERSGGEPSKCPTCGAPRPYLHPGHEEDGRVLRDMCPDPYHQKVNPEYFRLAEPSTQEEALTLELRTALELLALADNREDVSTKVDELISQIDKRLTDLRTEQPASTPSDEPIATLNLLHWMMDLPDELAVAHSKFLENERDQAAAAARSEAIEACAKRAEEVMGCSVDDEKIFHAIKTIAQAIREAR